MSSSRLKPFEYFEPTTIKEAVSVLNAYGAKAQVLAGGIDLIPRMRTGAIQADYVVNIQAIPGLRDITLDGEGLRFGAMTRLHDLEKLGPLKTSYPILYDAVHQITSVQTKCMGTAVGNICVATPASDVAVALMALDARLRVAGPDGEREIPMSEFYKDYRRTALTSGEAGHRRLGTRSSHRRRCRIHEPRAYPCRYRKGDGRGGSRNGGRGVPGSAGRSRVGRTRDDASDGCGSVADRAEDRTRFVLAGCCRCG